MHHRRIKTLLEGNVGVKGGKSWKPHAKAWGGGYSSSLWIYLIDRYEGGTINIIAADLIADDLGLNQTFTFTGITAIFSLLISKFLTSLKSKTVQ